MPSAARAEPLLFDFARTARNDLAAPPVETMHRGQTPSEVRREPSVIGSPSVSLVGGDPDGLKGIRATLICMATGLGKTKTASAFIKRWLGRLDWDAGLRPYQREDVETAWQQLTGGARDGVYRGRVLWAVSGDELCQMAQDELTAALDGEFVGREQGDLHASSERVVVGSVPTLKGARLESWAPSAFTLIIIDEAHHAPSPSYLAVTRHFANAKIIGLSATPKRHDKKSQRLVFQDWVKPVRNIPWGWKNGYLVPFVPVAVYVDGVDLSHIDASKGDLQLDELEYEIVKNVAPIARKSFEKVGDRRTLIYTPGVGSAMAVAEALNQMRPGCARYVHGDKKTMPMDLRRNIIASHKRGEYQFLVNCLVLKEGYDDRAIRAIVIARPTKSKGLYIQMAGRGGRTLIAEHAELADRLSAIAASDKPDCLLVDITGHAGRHNLISAVDLDGRYTDEQRARAKEVLARTPGARLDKALEDARKELIAEDRARKERAAKLAAQAKVRARTGTWDVFEGFNIERPDPGEETKWGAQSATPQDVAWLEKQGLPTTGMSHGEVAKLKRTAVAWRLAGLATFRQRKTLKKYDLPANVYFHHASALIDRIIAHGWSKPPAHEVTAILGQGRQVGAEG